STIRIVSPHLRSFPIRVQPIPLAYSHSQGAALHKRLPGQAVREELRFKSHRCVPRVTDATVSYVENPRVSRSRTDPEQHRRSGHGEAFPEFSRMSHGHSAQRRVCYGRKSSHHPRIEADYAEETDDRGQAC